VMRKSHAEGVGIPRDLAVVGFDNIRIAQYMSPPLTTIEMSQSELARIAFMALLEDVKRKTPNPKGTEYVLKTSLVLRESTSLNAEWAGMKQREVG
jgi:LacI family transcriptional regulator, galactose operon repressor